MLRNNRDTDAAANDLHHGIKRGHTDTVVKAAPQLFGVIFNMLLKRATFEQSDELCRDDLFKRRAFGIMPTAFCRRKHHQFVITKRERGQSVQLSRVSYDALIRHLILNCRDNVVTQHLFNSNGNNRCLSISPPP